MALHVRGVVLPDDEVRDLWLVDDRITLEPVPGAETVSDGGWIVPGLVDAHCHLGIAYGAKPIQSLDEARELARHDRDAGARAAVHTFSEEGVEIMVKAGVDSVEHGTGLSLDLIDEMARRGTALVPTMINIRTFGSIAEQARAKFAGYADHMVALRDRFPGVVRAAYEAGVPIYVGTDAGGGVRHGLAAEEMLLLHEAGIPAAEVLASASWLAREWLGFAGLVEGGLADLVVYPSDPRVDLRVVRHPQRIVLRGRVVK